jgi:hypothetical protein
MAAARKRSASKARKGTAGTPKTAQRKSPGTKARKKDGSGRVKGTNAGPVTREHPQSEPTKRASSRKRAAEAGETLSNKRAGAAKKKTTDITDGDVAKVPSLGRARAKDRGENSG